jgi:hypothetical protein
MRCKIAERTRVGDAFFWFGPDGAAHYGSLANGVRTIERSGALRAGMMEEGAAQAVRDQRLP